MPLTGRGRGNRARRRPGLPQNPLLATGLSLPPNPIFNMRPGLPINPILRTGGGLGRGRPRGR